MLMNALSKAPSLIFLFLLQWFYLSGQPQNGLQANYTFSDGSGSDAQGNFSAIANTALLTADRFGNANGALSFSQDYGTYIDLGAVMDGIFARADKRFSISLWFRPDDLMNNNMLVAKYANNNCGQQQRAFYVNIYNGKINFAYYPNPFLSPAQLRGVSGQTNIDRLNCWYHLVITYDANQGNNGLDRVDIYLNGQPETTFLSLNQGANGDIPVTNAHLGIGAALSTSGEICGNYVFEGAIDDILIYDRLLTLSEIRELYRVNDYGAPTIVNASICEGDIYEGYTTSGSYLDTFINANGCDSARLLNLQVRPLVATFESITICTGDSYQGFSESGVYTQLMSTVNGCDSIHTLTLLVNDYVNLNESAQICSGEHYRGYNQSGVYQDTLISNGMGCDTILQINLSVQETYRTSISIPVCEGESFPDNASAISIDTLTSIFGCDSFIIKNFSGIDIFIPNAISPNGDGVNDALAVFTSSDWANDHVIHEFQIFNRWGGLVFETTNAPFNTSLWDGKRQGIPLPTGSYSYYLTYLCQGQLIQYKGSITILK